LWGRETAGFLEGLDYYGYELAGTNEDSQELAHAQSEKRVPLSGQDLAKYKSERESLVKLLKNKNSACTKFLMKTFNLSGSRIANTVLGQRAFDGTRSTISLGDAGLDRQQGVFNNYYPSVQAYFNANASTTRAATAFYATPDDRGATPRDVYYAPIGIRASTILHESLHIFFGSRFPDDISLANHLGTSLENNPFAIDHALERGGCK